MPTASCRNAPTHEALDRAGGGRRRAAPGEGQPAAGASSRRGVEGIETAEECIEQAVIELAHIDSIRTASGRIRKNAAKIDKDCNSVQSSIEGLLSQALDALSGVALEAADISAERAISDDAGVA